MWQKSTSQSILNRKPKAHIYKCDVEKAKEQRADGGKLHRQESVPNIKAESTFRMHFQAKNVIKKTITAGGCVMFQGKSYKE